MEVMEDDEGKAILDRNDEPRRKSLNPRVELLYMYLESGM